MGIFKKTLSRREHVHKSITAERVENLIKVANKDIIGSSLLWLCFVILCVPLLAFEPSGRFITKWWMGLLPFAMVTLFICTGTAVYTYRYQRRLIKNHVRILAMIGLFLLLLVSAKTGYLLSGQTAWATGTAIIATIILTITYDQRFALGISLFYCALACLAVATRNDTGLAVGTRGDIGLFFTMSAGSVSCCFALKEIRTRMKLLEVGAATAAIVLAISVSTSFIMGESKATDIFRNAGFHAIAALSVAILIQSLLPLIEKTFKVATSMTLLDYSDANQPLLKKLAMDAPGTYSHSLLIGSIAEAAAESIGRNGLLCRVGAYYHDVGKINKPSYFIENEFGSESRHTELSPALSQLIIVGHVKDGIELAKEYGLPAVLMQFIEAHHGTTLVEYFYHEAKKKLDENHSTVSEVEFRYPGPKPRTKEAAIVMLADSVEGAVRSLHEITPPKIETVIHNMAMKRLQDGQFDECDLTLGELSTIEASMAKTLAAHHHGRIAYPEPLDQPSQQ